MKGPGPPPPLGTTPNGVDINQPKYSFDTDEWKKAPKLSNESFRNTDSVVSRNKNDSDYFTIGNQTTWHQYIVLGYHCYDDCFQFETQWERMIQSESDTLTYIWYVYTYHCNTKLEMPTVLQNWAMDIAKPYLERNYPDRLTPDTTDPRNGRFQYTESDLMDIEEDEEEGKPAALLGVTQLRCEERSKQHGTSHYPVSQETRDTIQYGTTVQHRVLGSSIGLKFTPEPHWDIQYSICFTVRYPAKNPS